MGNKSFRFLTLSFLLFVCAGAQALVKVNVEKLRFNGTDAFQPLLDKLDGEIRQGAWDDQNLLFPLSAQAAAKADRNSIRVKDGRPHLLVTSANYSRLSPEIRRSVVTRMASFYDNGNWGSYRVTVDTKLNDLSQEPLLAALGVETKGLPQTVPAEKLLSAYAQKWAYKVSGGPGANCWHTSIASINHGWELPRRMLPPEFLCHLRNSFESIDEPSQWGDLIRLASGNEEVHGFTFLGVDKNEPTKRIVFTKNGYMQGYFQFMDLEGVKSIYSGTDATFFRRTRPAVDPKSDPGAICAHPIEINGESAEAPEADALVRAGLRKTPATSFPAL